MNNKLKLCAGLISGALLVGCDNGTTIAEVGSRDISREEFVSYLNSKGVKGDSLAGREAQLNQYVNDIALFEAIESEGDLDLAQINQKVEDYRRNLILNEYFDQYLKKTVTEDAVQNYFSSNPSEFESEKVNVAHILIRTNSGMTDDELALARTRVLELLGRLKQGESFAELAENNSDDRLSGHKGGDLGWLPRGAVSPAFSDVAFSLKAGEYSDPVKTDYGYHIVTVLDEARTDKVDFSQVEGEIRYTLKSRAKQAETDRLLKSVDVEVDQEALK